MKRALSASCRRCRRAACRPSGVTTQRFVSTYFSLFREPQVYSSFDWGIKDKDGYHYILGRTDDVINVAGHRLGTREIEEAIQGHPAIAEVAVVGVADR
jgi:propionyl-CoA synthetase